MKTIYYCFPGGKHKVLTMSYDDGRIEDRKLIPIFNTYGIKGTFHVNSGRFEDPRRIKPEEFKELYKGHEVSCHTSTHPTIERCPMEQIVREVMDDRAELERLMGYPVRGLSYPNGSYNKAIVDVLPRLGIRYARTVHSTEGFGMPDNFLEWKATCHHTKNLMELGKKFIALNKTQYLYMMYVWGHSYEFSNDNNWDLMEDFCKLTGGRDDTWYATNIQIVDYMEVCERLQFSSDLSFVYNPSVHSAWLNVGRNIMEIKGGEQVSL